MGTEMNDILSIVKELCSYSAEREWFEFKHNWFEPEQLGQYISALSNSAAMEGRSKAYFVWGIDEDTFKKNLGFFTYDGKYNILAQLMSDNSHLPLRFAIFSGKTKTSTLFSVREFGYQCLLYSLDEVLRYGDVLNIIQADERNRIVERKETALFENDAFREAMINAFVHNKWVEGNEPMISVFSDRIEILSRGTFPPEQTLEGFFAGESVPVNQKLSEIFLQLHISEKTGRGVPKVIEKYGKEAYEFRENSIVVKIPFRWINPTNWDIIKNAEK